jgi:hypothetical protein
LPSSCAPFGVGGMRALAAVALTVMTGCSSITLALLAMQREPTVMASGGLGWSSHSGRTSSHWHDVPCEDVARLHGGPRSVPDEPGPVDGAGRPVADARAKLVQQYTDFIAVVDGQRPLKGDSSRMHLPAGTWICITPKEWRPCESYDEAVALFRAATAEGLPVCVDQVAQERHGDLCCEEELDAIPVAVSAPEAYESAESTVVECGPFPYYVTTALPAGSYRFATLEDHRRLMRAHPLGL